MNKCVLNKATIILNRKSYDDFKQLGTILEEKEVAIIDMRNGKKITVIGDGKTPAIDCRKIDFPYTEIICSRRSDKTSYTIKFVNNTKGVDDETESK